MKIISIGTDRNIFEEGSAVRARMVEYAGLFEELHLIVFSRRNYKAFQLAPNCFVYPTRSFSRWFYVRGAVRIGRSIIKGMADVSNVIVDSQDPFECGLVASRVARAFTLPLHVQIHTDFLSPHFAAQSLLNRIRVFIARRVLPQARAVRVVSERIKASLSQINCRATIFVLPVFTDVRRFKEEAPAFSLHEKYPQWSFIMLAVSRLSSEKNVSHAIRILKQVRKKYPHTGLVVVGDGPRRGALGRQVFWHGLSKHVAFEGWQNDLVSYYKTTNLFVQTSMYEGFGLSLLEAAASGCPAVSSDVGIAPELLNHKGHSFLCPVGDTPCFLEKISELIENNQLREFTATQILPEAVQVFVRSKEEYLVAYKASFEAARTL